MHRLLPGRAAGVVALPLCLGLALPACGGSEPSATPAATQSVAARPAGRAAPGTVTPPLLDDEGRPNAALPRAEPADPGARTRSGHYALQAQALELERALGGHVLWLAGDCCGSHAVDIVAGVGHALIASGSLNRDAPVFVTGHDLRVAAVVADRIEAEGMRRVFLVTDSSRQAEAR